MKRCRVCETDFTPNSNRQMYCSAACRRGTSECRTCRKTFVLKSKTTGNYCSRRCWYVATDDEVRACTKCGAKKAREDFPKSRGGDASYWCRACHHARYTEQRSVQRQTMLSTEFADFAERLRRDRKARGLTQIEVGVLAGVTHKQVANWEAGASLPRQRHLLKLCEAFGWKMPYTVRPGENWRIPLGVMSCERCQESFPFFRKGSRFCSKACAGRLRTGPGGGRSLKGGGYLAVKVPGHPNADSKGYVPEHRFVMSQMLGRPLEPHERVHHKNGRRDDNRPENLELWKGKTSKDPSGVRAMDYHCAGCRCGE